MKKHWATMNDFGFIAGMRLLFWVCKVFGRWPFRLLLYPVLVWYVLVKPTARRASRDYLRHVNRITPINTGLITILRHFAAFAEMMLEKMMLWSGLFDSTSVRFYGADHMGQLIAQKRGALIICSHLGNFDLCRVLSSHHAGIKLTVLVHTKHARIFNHLLTTMNPKSQLNVMQVTEISAATAMILAEKVTQGEFVVIAGDRIPVADKPRVVMAPFLGEPACFPIGPYILANALGCPILMLFSLRRVQRGQEHHEIHFELLRESVQLPRKAREQALSELVAVYAARLEAYCLSAPLQWFNFYDYWDIR